MVFTDCNCRWRWLSSFKASTTAFTAKSLTVVVLRGGCSPRRSVDDNLGFELALPSSCQSAFRGLGGYHTGLVT